MYVRGAKSEQDTKASSQMVTNTRLHPVIVFWVWHGRTIKRLGTESPLQLCFVVQAKQLNDIRQLTTNLARPI